MRRKCDILIYKPDKFPYAMLKKQTLNGSRKYMTPEGRAVPSVTTILDKTKSEESKKALMEWRKRVGPIKAQEITTEAAGRGTRMHKFLENYIKNNDMGTYGTNPYSKQSFDMANTVVKQGLSRCQEIYGTEVSLYFPEVYAGTTDVVGMFEKKIAIMDFKQTNKPKKREWIDDYFIQTTAYALAHNEVYNTKINKGVIFMCDPNLQYQEFVIEGKEFKHYTNLWYQKLEEYYSKFV